MSHINNLLKPLAIAIAICAFIAFPTNAQTTQEASLLVDPEPGTTLNRNAVIPFTISVNSNEEPINVVALTVQYDQSDLEFVGFDGSDSSFEFAAPTEPSGNGVVFITRGTPTQGGLTGQSKIGVVNFKVLADSGDTTLSFGEDSHVIRIGATDIWDRSTAIGTYNLLPSTVDSAENTTTTQNTNDDKLVAIKVTDSNNQPLPNKTVIIGNRTATTDNSGTASFGGLPSDTFTVEVQDEDGTKIAESEITVTEDTAPTEVQTFDLRVEEDGSPLGIILAVVGVIVILALIVIFIRKTGIMNRSGSKKNVVNNPYADIDALSQRQNQPNPANNVAQAPQQQAPPAPGEEINPQQ